MVDCSPSTSISSYGCVELYVRRFFSAANEASQCSGWTLSAGSLVYQIQAYRSLRKHSLQRVGGGAAVRVLGAVLPAGGLPHHHV